MPPPKILSSLTMGKDNVIHKRKINENKSKSINIPQTKNGKL